MFPAPLQVWENEWKKDRWSEDDFCVFFLCFHPRSGARIAGARIPRMMHLQNDLAFNSRASPVFPVLSSIEQLEDR